MNPEKSGKSRARDGQVCYDVYINQAKGLQNV
jgi:hypothetical protein